jgi:hypothetical protein
LTDGYTSYEGKKHLSSVIAVKEKKLGKEHKQVLQDRKLLEELEKPPEVVQVVKVVPVVQKKMQVQHDEWLPPPQASWGGYMTDSDIMILDDAPPPPPPPAPPMASFTPPPPPPPGTKMVSPSSYLQEIQSIEKSAPKLKKAVVKKKQNNIESRAGWWKQNYQYNAKPE